MLASVAAMPPRHWQVAFAARVTLLLLLLNGACFVLGQAAPLDTPPPAESSATTAAARIPATELSTASATLSTAPSQLLVPARLSSRDKFNRFVHHTYAPSTYLDAAFDASYLQATGDMYELGGGMEGWGKRYGYMVANSQIKSFAKDFFFPTVLHQDPRYLPKRTGTFRSRLFYAATRVVVGRTDDGRSTFNSSKLLSVIVCKSLYNAYYPASERGAGRTGTRIASTLGSDAGDYVREEFWPELTRVLYRHTPGKLLPIVHRITSDSSTDVSAAQQPTTPAPQPATSPSNEPSSQR